MAPKTDRKAVASRKWINVSTGEEVDEELATGVSYSLLAMPDRPIIWSFATEPEAAKNMLSGNGFLNIIGNEINSVLNAAEPGTPEEALAAAEARLALLRSGTWVDRTREGGGGVRYVKQSLAEAIFHVTKKESVEFYLAKLDTRVDIATGQQVADDAKNSINYGRRALKIPAVAKQYEKLQPKTVSVPDVGSL